MGVICMYSCTAFEVKPNYSWWSHTTDAYTHRTVDLYLHTGPFNCLDAGRASSSTSVTTPRKNSPSNGLLTRVPTWNPSWKRCACVHDDDGYDGGK